jgi:membrane glycosyltransferase
MKNGFQVHRSDWLVIGVFLLLGGLVLLFMIDFFWGVLCFVGSFTCFYQAIVHYEKGAGPNRSPGEW